MAEIDTQPSSGLSPEKLTPREPGPVATSRRIDSDEGFLTPERVAQMTPFSPVTIRRKCARGEIRATKRLGKWLIYPVDYREWLKAGEPEPGVMRPQPRRRMAEPASRWHLRAINGGGDAS